MNKRREIQVAASPRTVVVDLSLRSGGAQRRVLELGGVAEHRRAWQIVHLRGSELETQIRRHAVEGVALNRRRWDPRLVTDIVRLLRAGAVEVLDAHNVAAQLWGPVAARLARTPKLVCTVHSDYATEHGHHRRGRWYLRILRLADLLGADLVAVAPNVCDALERDGFATGHITTVPNAVPAAPCFERDGAMQRGDLGISDTSFVVACTARLEPVKRVPVLLEALAGLARSGVDAHLVVVGDGSERAALVERAERLGLASRAHFLGRRDDVFDVLGMADCFCLISASEGLPYAPLEATIAGLPLVLTRVGALPGVVGEDGALLVPVDDPDAVTAALAALAESPRLRASLSAVATSRTRAALTQERLVASTRAVHSLPPRRLPIARQLLGRLADTRSIDPVLRLAGRASRQLLPKAGTLHVLTYHRVAPATDDQTLDPVLVSATPQEFEEQMRFVRNELQPIDIGTVVAALRGEVDLPARAVHVTFDDGYRDVAQHAAPVLQRYGVPATLFVPTAYPDAPARDFWWDRLHRALSRSSAAVLSTPVGSFPLDGRPASVARATKAISAHVKSLSHEHAMAVLEDIVADAGGTEPINAVLGWEQLAELRAVGVAIAPHSRTHAALDRLPIDQLHGEVRGALDDIRAHLGASPAVFAYPTGQTSDSVRAELKRAGYVAAFSTEPGSNDLAATDPLLLRRVDVTRKVSANSLNVLLSPAGRIVRRLL